MGDDEPVIDLLDRRGRLVRLFIAAGATIVTFVVVGPALYVWVDPAHQASSGGWKFVFYLTAMAGGIVFVVVGTLLRWRAKRREEAEQIPKARVV